MNENLEALKDIYDVVKEVENINRLKRREVIKKFDEIYDIIGLEFVGKHEDEISKEYPNNNTVWTKKEVRDLDYLSRIENKSIIDISEIMGRTPLSVKLKLQSITLNSNE